RLPRWIGREGARRGQGSHEELVVHGRNHDRNPLGDNRWQAARVIKVMMRNDTVPDRLVRNYFSGFGDNLLRARFALGPRLKKHDLIGHLHSERIVRAIDPEYAIRKFLRRRAGSRLLASRWSAGATLTGRSR